MNMLAESFDNVPPKELKMEVDNLPNFFFEVLQFREIIKNDVKMNEDPQVSLKDIVLIEESASKALHLKLSEIIFRPYDKLYEWAIIHGTNSEI